MGMLTEDEMLTALSNNLDDKEYWTVKPTYPLDKEYAEVVSSAVKVYQKVKYGTLLEKICDNHCKYLATINGHCSGNDFQVRNIDELEKHCNKCPLKSILSEEKEDGYS